MQVHRSCSCIGIVFIDNTIFRRRNHRTTISHRHSRLFGRSVIIIHIRTYKDLRAAYWFWLDSDCKRKRSSRGITYIVMIGIANKSVIYQIILGIRTNQPRSRGREVRSISTVLKGSMICATRINQFLNIHVVGKILGCRSRIGGGSLDNLECSRTINRIVTTIFVCDSHHWHIFYIDVVTIAYSVFRGINHCITVLHCNSRL